MKNYLEIFLKTHLTYWWVYLLSIVVLFFNVIITLVVAFLLFHAMPTVRLAHIGTTVVFTMISSALFILPNYQVGKQFQLLSTKMSAKHYAFWLQFIFTALIFIFAFVVLKITIDEF